ncbi:MAG: methyltransferase domain-containing protein [Planctomycetes bacterium]|nr:methyltransferase domain-containing protein [Planctomycetota bacterium]
MTTNSEAKRLEALWSGEFGDAYVDRNTGVHDRRGEFFAPLLRRFPARRVLEVGCNLGGNLRWMAESVPPHEVYGVDVNQKALRQARAALPDVNLLSCPGRELPFRDGWFDLVFTMGVLIHQPEQSLPLVMQEMVRCSRRWILCGEYFAEKITEVPYRGVEGALFKRDYGTLFQELFPELIARDRGFLGKADGWDDITWWLFEKP